MPFDHRMKEFSCGDVVPTCSHSFRGESDDEILAQVARHARDDHRLADVSPELVSAVRSAIRAVDGA